MASGAEKLKTSPNDPKVKAAIAAIESEFKALMAEHTTRLAQVGEDPEALL
jgi:hypothetical protein